MVAASDNVLGRVSSGHEDSDQAPVPGDPDAFTAEQIEMFAEAWQKRKRVDELREEGRIRLVPNHYFFLNGDSKLPEAAASLRRRSRLVNDS